MKKIFFFIPIGYFLITRLKNAKNLVFHSYFEWFPAIGILLFLENMVVFEAVESFLLGYIAFISIYEIGYLTNDQLSEKNELNPRKRQDKTLSAGMFISLIAVRLAVFCGLTFYMGLQSSLLWWCFYMLLILSFLLHNSISNSDYRLVTFLNLSVFRFYAPFFIFTSPEVSRLIFPVVLICYSFFRTLIYMDNKDLLNVKSRKNPLFNFSFYLITLLIVVFYSVLSETTIPIYLAIYFMIFTFTYFLKRILFNG